MKYPLPPEPKPKVLDYTYAFTWTPDPKRYKTTDPIEQWKTLLNCVLCKSQIRKTFCDFYFIPELTLEGNIHVHGFYKIKNNISYYRWFLPACKQWGWTRIKDRVDEEWLLYVSKSTPQMLELCTDGEVPYMILECDHKEICYYFKKRYGDKPRLTINKLNNINKKKSLDITKYFII